MEPDAVTTEAVRRSILAAYSAGTITAIDARRRLGSATFGELLRMLADEGLTLPRTSTAGREEILARARTWLFPKPRPNRRTHGQ